MTFLCLEAHREAEVKDSHILCLLRGAGPLAADTQLCSKSEVLGSCLSLPLD